MDDHWQSALVYMFFNGPKNTILCQFKDNDMVYLKLSNIEKRFSDGAASITANMELAILKAMLNAGARHRLSKVGRVPYIPVLKG